MRSVVENLYPGVTVTMPDGKKVAVRRVEHRACSRYKTHINGEFCIDTAMPVEVEDERSLPNRDRDVIELSPMELAWYGRMSSWMEMS